MLAEPLKKTRDGRGKTYLNDQPPLAGNILTHDLRIQTGKIRYVAYSRIPTLPFGPAYTTHPLAHSFNPT